MTIFKKIKAGLEKTSQALRRHFGAAGVEKICNINLESIEESLLLADFGLEATKMIAKNVQDCGILKTKDYKSISSYIQGQIAEILNRSYGKLECQIDKDKNSSQSGGRTVYILMMCGINGSGKTTTSGKLAQYMMNRGYKVALVGCDTFRAAAIEQLEIWAKRAKCDFFSGASRQDPAGVAFDSIEKSIENNCDVVIIDTAGRLQNNSNLMSEVSKTYRSILKSCESAQTRDKSLNCQIHPILVLDSTIGQNTMSQVNLFSAAIPLSGLVMTKLDGTAKGGIILAISDKYSLPIYWIGVGEKIDDLVDFSVEDFSASII